MHKHIDCDNCLELSRMPTMEQCLFFNGNNELYLKAYSASIEPQFEWDVITRIETGVYNPTELEV